MLKNSWVNGESAQSVSVLDRGLAYGDGLFETLRLQSGVPCYLDKHLARLQQGAERLKMPLDVDLLRRELLAFLQESGQKALLSSLSPALLKIVVSRGVSERGYRYSKQLPCTRILLLFESASAHVDHQQSGIAVRLCSTLINDNPALAGIKHLNRLENVLARSEWDDADIQEGLMMDRSQRVVEGTMSNLFIVIKGVLLTPSVEQAGIAGIMRAVIMEKALAAGLQVGVVEPFAVDQIKQADEIFVCNSVIGIWPVIRWDALTWPIGPVTRQLQQWVGHCDAN
ncbi:MAG TPA: aminodeoxychorismate lyase [Pseudomonadales bacterium]|nr:aminodeoxychorismate lyase [Pseudomonadales bacterium]